MSLFSREPQAPWDLQILTATYAVTGTVVEDDQPSGGYRLRPEVLGVPAGSSLRLTGPVVAPVREHPVPATLRARGDVCRGGAGRRHGVSLRAGGRSGPSARG